MKIKLIILSLVLSSTFAHADIFGTGTNQFTIDFVNIGHAGNAADASGYGAVGYDYRIGKYEITIDQFMKAQAIDGRIGDGNENRWNDGIRTVGLNAPASRVSWLESAKFANWLTTGDAYSGAYQFDGSGTLLSVNRASAISTYGTVYVIPSEDEWYKVAYFNADSSGYSLYASGLDTVPIHGTTEGWNYYNGSLVNADPNYTWEVGFGGEEQNGTYDMNGNVYEWVEGTEDGVLDDLLEWRVIRGGKFTSLDSGLRATDRSTDYPEDFSSTTGLRIAAIPEPSSVLLLTIGSGGLLFYRRAKRREQARRRPSRRDFL